MSPTVLYSEETGLGLGDPDVALEGTGRSVPRGIESQFEYNGLLMNDRTVIDKYRIISIDGLDDPDVRDSRDENAASHGETPNFALYGGRTIAITGRIEAYTLAKLRDMQQALRTAFLDINEEMPLNFITGNSATDHYINCKKFSKNQWGEEQRDKHVFFRDFVITLRASDPRFYGLESITTSIFPNLIRFYGFESGNASGWASSTTGTPGWSASAASGASGISTAWTAEGTYSWLLNYKKNPGVVRQAFNFTTAMFMPVTASATYQFSTYINALDNPASGIKAVITYYSSAFTPLSAASSSPYLGQGITQLSVEAQAPVNSVWAKATIQFQSSIANDHAWMYIDDAFFGKIEGNVEGGRVLVTNVGNFQSHTIFKFYGNIASASIENETTDLTFSLKDSVTIADGDFYQANSSNKSIIDSAGDSKFSGLDPSSDWILIEPGDNWLNLSSSSLGGSVNSRVDIITRNAWL